MAPPGVLASGPSALRSGPPGRRCAAAGPPPSSSGPADRPRRFAPLRRLEDHNLLSATPLGGAFLVNTYTNGPQQTFSPGPPGPPAAHRAVAMNPKTGDFVVTWSSQGQDNGGGWGVYAQS